MATCSEGRLIRRKTERALLVVLAADANTDADAAVAELAVNLSAVRCRRLTSIRHAAALPSTPARSVVRLRNRTAQGRLVRRKTERALLGVLAAAAAAAVAVAVLAVNLSAVRCRRLTSIRHAAALPSTPARFVV